MPPRDVRQVSKRIDRAGHDRAGRADERDSAQTSFAVTRDRGLQCRNVDPHVLVDRDQAQVRASNTEHRNRLRNRHVDLFGGVDHARLRTIFVRRSARLARHRERHQVPSEPPLVKVPAKPLQPIAPASHPSTLRSIATAAGAERHAVTFWFSTDA